MFISLIKYLKGYLLVRLYGYSPERFLNLCSNHNILIWDLVCVENEYEFHISIDGYRRLKPLLKKTRTKLSIKKRIGFPFFVYQYRKRKVFFAGIVLSLGILIYMTTFVWLIDINGNSTITDEAVLAFLEEQNTSFGTAKRKIDCAKLEEDIRKVFKDVVWVSVQLNGAKMTIDMQENLISQNSVKQEELDGELDIVANKDAVITSIITRKGTPFVREKSVVKAGDILVGSRLDIYDDNNEIEEYLYVTSDADIYGQTEYIYEDSFPMNYTEKKETGKRWNQYSFRCFGAEIKLPDFHTLKEPYISYTENIQLAIAKDYFIPVFVEKTTISECTYQKIQLTKEDAKKEAAEKISYFLKKLGEKGIQILDKNVIIEFKGNQCQFKAKITVNEKIGKYAPAEILKISTDERLIENESD